jgi:hypothetical protein
MYRREYPPIIMDEFSHRRETLTSIFRKQKNQNEKYCGSGMFIPNAESKFRIPDPDPHQRIKAFLTQKIVSRLSEI